MFFFKIHHIVSRAFVANYCSLLVVESPRVIFCHLFLKWTSHKKIKCCFKTNKTIDGKYGLWLSKISKDMPKLTGYFSNLKLGTHAPPSWIRAMGPEYYYHLYFGPQSTFVVNSMEILVAEGMQYQKRIGLRACSCSQWSQQQNPCFIYVHSHCLF